MLLKLTAIGSHFTSRIVETFDQCLKKTLLDITYNYADFYRMFIHSIVLPGMKGLV